MEGVAEKRQPILDDKRVLLASCSQCGGAIHQGKELVVDDKLVLCEGCYLCLVRPDTGDDIPSQWF